MSNVYFGIALVLNGVAAQFFARGLGAWAGWAFGLSFGALIVALYAVAEALKPLRLPEVAVGIIPRNEPRA